MTLTLKILVQKCQEEQSALYVILYLTHRFKITKGLQDLKTQAKIYKLLTQSKI